MFLFIIIIVIITTAITIIAYRIVNFTIKFKSIKIYPKTGHFFKIITEYVDRNTENINIYGYMLQRLVCRA